jgi:hypothetical protein
MAYLHGKNEVPYDTNACFVVDKHKANVGLSRASSINHQLVALAISLLIMLVCALTFCIVILCVNHIIWLTMTNMSNLPGWLC